MTITGVGGVGKTSLAIEVARDFSAYLPDGTWMVPMASLDDPQLVGPEVVGALGLNRPAGVDEGEVLVDHLRDRRSLLVLDNCEHLIDAVAGLADTLLRRCPELRILATSRRELDVGGEAVFSLPPLAVPAVGAGMAEVSESPSVQLLVERARLKQPGFALSEFNADSIAVICRRVAGIPLGLELAAARLQSMTPDEMARRMDDQFELLTTGSRAAEPRQRTLEATMDWSYRLLRDDEQALLRRAALFRGGFRLEAAEAVTIGELVPASRVADLLGRLVEASLVSAEIRGDATIYSMLEPVRQYGLRLLDEAGDSEATRERHFTFCLLQAGQLLDHYQSGRWSNVLRMGEAIADDCREALSWAAKTGRGDTALQLAARLCPYWTVAGRTAEGHASLTVALEASSRRPTPDRIRAADHCARFAIGIGRPADRWLDELEEGAAKLGTAEMFGRAAGTRGLLAFARGDLNAAHDMLAEAYQRDLQAGRPARAGVLLAECLIRIGRFDEAERLLDELDRWESAQDEYGNHAITVALGMLAYCRGDLHGAEKMLEIAVKAFGEQQSSAGQMESMMYLGWVSLDLGNERRSRMLAERSLALARREADILYEATNLWLLARVALRRDELAETRTALEACMEVARRRRESVILAFALLVWADLAAAQGELERAAHLFGAAGRALAAIPHIMPPSMGREYDETIDELQRSLGVDVFEALHRTGSGSSLEEAVDFALKRLSDS